MTLYTLATQEGPLGRYSLTGPLEVVPRGLRSSWRSHSEAAVACQAAAVQFGMVFLVEEEV